MSEAELLQKYEPFIRSIVKSHLRKTGFTNYKDDYEDRLQVARMWFMRFVRIHGEEKAKCSYKRIYHALNNYVIKMGNGVNIPRNKFFKVAETFESIPIDESFEVEASEGSQSQMESNIMLEGFLSSLNEEEQKIAKMLIDGYRHAEICRALGHEDNRFWIYGKIKSIRDKAKIYYQMNVA